MNSSSVVRILSWGALAAIWGLAVGCGRGEIPADHASPAEVDAVKQGFASPPGEARPRVWWHWMNGNITKEGIAKDLEWMHRVGIGGLQNFDAALDTPIVVDQRLVYMSPDWQKAFRFAVEKAAALGLEFGIASSPGWSETGGPWVPPEDGMKKLVWSGTRVTGGQAFEGELPHPPDVTGPYQTLKAVSDHPHNPEVVPEHFYRDVAVLTIPQESVPALPPPQSITANGKPVTAEILLDANLATGIDLPGNVGDAPGMISLHYAEPQTIRSAEVFVANLPRSIMQGPLVPRLEALTAANEWQPVAELALGTVPTTASFPPVTAREFRLLLTRGPRADNSAFALAPGVDFAGLGSVGSAPSEPPLLTELRLSAEPRVNAFEVKAGFALVDDYHAQDDDVGPDLEAVDPRAVVDLTDRMTEDGRLSWDAPAGDWNILRLGYSLTGKTNAPATQEATGLEVDKYDADAVERYLETYLGMYRDVVGAGLVGKRGVRALLTDSTEVGPSNWTPGLRAKFRQLRGYDPTPWLPALTGQIVGSRAQSDGFLYDFRRTLAQLSATEHYGTVARVAHEYGLTVYGESLEANRMVSSLGDDLEMRRFADIPMAAMWTYGADRSPSPSYVADMRGAASVAHLYGRSYVAAESLTSILMPWAHSPADLQPMIDAEFASGVNRPVIHTAVHQPLDDRQPGMSLHIFGQFFTRHETWAEMARPWIDYIARSSFLLQQGRNVADVAYFYGEEPPIGVLAAKGYPEDVPQRHAYDFISPEGVLNALSVQDGALVSDGGARYRVLFLGGSSRDHMTLPVLERLQQLVQAGATIVGRAPAASPSLGDDSGEFSAIVDRLWSGDRVTTVGGGRVFADDDVEAALADLGVRPDFIPGGDAPVQFVHRHTEEGEIYYVSNRGTARQVEARFRVTGRAPQIWRADAGTIEPVSYRIEDGATVVPLAFGDRESLFVVFREPAVESSRTVPTDVVETVAEIGGPWQIAFQAGRGAPAGVTLDSLVSLSEHEDPGIRYFSGLSTYRNRFDLPEAVEPGQHLLLDLGRIGDVAEVYVNGQLAGTAWKAPYRVNVGPFARQGSNELEIRVANLWVNRLIGDQQPGATPLTYTTFSTYRPDAPLRPSGLLGPVTLGVKRPGQPGTDAAIGRTVVSTIPVDDKLQVRSATYAHSGKVLVSYAGEAGEPPDQVNLAVMDDDGSHFRPFFSQRLPIRPKANGIRFMPFADNRRIFLGDDILECKPDLDNCEQATLLPVTYPAPVAGGDGILLRWSEIIVAPDNEHVAWTTLLPDMGALVFTGKLRKGASGYDIVEPRIISTVEPFAADPDKPGTVVPRTIRGGEVKQFVHGGTAISLVGLKALNTADSVVQDLASDAMEQVTYTPGYDETTIFSPDEKLGITMSSRFSPATDLAILGLLPRPYPANLDMGLTMLHYTHAVTGVRTSRKGNIGPALIDIAKSSSQGDYRGIDLNTEDVWVFHSPMSWHPSGKKAMWIEGRRGTRQRRIQVVNLPDYQPKSPVAAQPTPDSIPYAIPDLSVLDKIIGRPNDLDVRIDGRHSGYITYRRSVDGHGSTVIEKQYVDFSDDGKSVYDGRETSRLALTESVYTAQVTLTGPRSGVMDLQLTFGPLRGAPPAELIFAPDESGKPRSRGYAEYDGDSLTVDELIP